MNKTIENIGDAELSSSLGNNVKVPLPETKYTNVIRVTTELGTVEDDSGTEQSWSSDAEVDLYDAIKLHANGEKWSVPGEFVEYLNVFKEGKAVKAQLEIDLRTIYRTGSGNIRTGMVRGVDFSNLQLELQLDKVPNLSENGTQQSGTEIIVTGVLTRNKPQSGKTKALMNVNSSIHSVASGEDQFDLQETGQIQRVIVKEENGLDLDEFEATLYTDEDEYEFTDERVSVIRERNEKKAGTEALPEGYYLVDVGNIDFSDEEVRFVRFNTDSSSSGKARVFTIGAKGP